jgi:putative NIF3 family GTP cyclohydrolase 1 type 2
LQDIPGAPLEDTVDTFKCGDPSQEVKGVVTTFLASYEVIQKAITLGANLIITHEPTYYNHLDEVGDALADNLIYQAKRRLLDEHGIVVWRFHDHWHRHQPDGIMAGVVQQLGWEAFLESPDAPVFTVPATSLRDLVAEVKAKLAIETVRVVGDLGMTCQRVALLVGSPPAKWQLMALAREDVDVLLTGEVNEWETSEAARDAIAQGRSKALVVLGHANSEEPGMAYLVSWLKERVPDLPVTHVPVGDAFQYV